ncbi:MAG: ATP synthase F1 subunit delta [Bacteroidota bacterium]
MKNLRVAGRYAKSLIDLAIERNQLEEVNKDMETLRELVKVRDFALLLKSPVVPPSKKKSILDTVLEGRVGEMMMGFVRILVNKGREKDLIDISDAFSDQYRAIKNISAVKVTSAKPVDTTILQQIERQLVAAGKTESQIEFTTKVDPELIGGFIIEFDGKVYDASVAHKLNQLRKDFDQPNVYISQIDAS